jgi:hypothetical protein
MSSPKWMVEGNHGDVIVTVSTLGGRLLPVEAQRLAAELLVVAEREAAFRASVYPAAMEPTPITSRSGQ